MPLTAHQEEVARLLAANRTFDSYLAGGHPAVGYVLHPIDLAINKLLTLAGRDEARDFLDILDLDRRTLPLGALCWAAAGKDSGFTPKVFVALRPDEPTDAVPHYGRPGGVLPRIIEDSGLDGRSR